MRQLSVLAIAAVVLVSFCDNFSQFPVIAPYARSLGATPAFIGVVVAAYSATNLAGNVLAGFMIDRFGRKRLLVIGLLTTAGVLLVYAVVRYPSELVAVRAAHGLAAAILAPAAFTLLGDIFPRESRGRAMGANGALIALAAMVAPALGGIVRDRWGFVAVFLTVAALVAGAALLAQLFVRETHHPKTGDHATLPVLLALATRRSLSLAYVPAIALTFGLGTLVTYLPLHLSDLGHGGAQTGVAFSAFAVLAMLAMASPLGRIGDVRGRLQPLAWGLSLAGVGLALLPAWQQLPAILACMALYGLGFGLVFPAANAQVADVTIPSERGSAFGLFYGFYSVGVILGATISGLLAEEHALFGLSPFLLAASAALLVGPGTLLAARGTAAYGQATESRGS